MRLNALITLALITLIIWVQGLVAPVAVEVVAVAAVEGVVAVAVVEVS